MVSGAVGVAQNARMSSAEVLAEWVSRKVALAISANSSASAWAALDDSNVVHDARSSLTIAGRARRDYDRHVEARDSLLHGA